MKTRRLAAFSLVIFLVFQCLPLTMPSPADFPDGAKVEAKSFFEPLRVCEHGEGLAAYLADHPWVPGTAFFLCPCVRESSFPGTVNVGLPEGFPPAVYKPPRAVSS
jgi:hypothetical protein